MPIYIPPSASFTPQVNASHKLFTSGVAVGFSLSADLLILKPVKHAILAQLAITLSINNGTVFAAGDDYNMNFVINGVASSYTHTVTYSIWQNIGTINIMAVNGKDLSACVPGNFEYYVSDPAYSLPAGQIVAVVALTPPFPNDTISVTTSTSASGGFSPTNIPAQYVGISTLGYW